MFIYLSCQYSSLYSVLPFMSYISDVNSWLESWQHDYWSYTGHYRAALLLNDETYTQIKSSSNCGKLIQMSLIWSVLLMQWLDQNSLKWIPNMYSYLCISPKTIKSFIINLCCFLFCCLFSEWKFQLASKKGTRNNWIKTFSPLT